jgi:thiol-disulfide isomerase/thioredoxin
MVQTQEIVSAERFASGLTYQQWMDVIHVNKAKFQENYDGTTIEPEDAAAFRALAAKPDGPAKMLIIGEDWCPDVYRGLPVLIRIAEAAGMEVRIFFRDERGEDWPKDLPFAKDIHQHYLKDGKFESIPTAIFYTRDMQYVAHWIERPEEVTREQSEWLQSLGNLTPEELKKAREENQKTERWANWRRLTVKDVRRLLEEATR